ncbi:hypothetical protein C809_03943 [Lachnospiraceae bacterium MD335]|nr:hypothetical protein C809_03943 [Lachnospiraceae bacterium MD335]
MAAKKFGYVRVSTREQNPDRQIYIYCGTRRASTSVTFMWRKNRGGSLSARCTAHWWTTSCGKATCW